MFLSEFTAKAEAQCRARAACEEANAIGWHLPLLATNDRFNVFLLTVAELLLEMIEVEIE